MYPFGVLYYSYHCTGLTALSLSMLTCLHADMFGCVCVRLATWGNALGVEIP